MSKQQPAGGGGGAALPDKRCEGARIPQCPCDADGARDDNADNMAATKEGVSTAMDRFTRALFCDIARGSQGNVCLSPFSIGTALAMTLGGAAGDTAKQIRTTLGHAEDAGDVHDGYRGLLAALENPPNVALNAANRLYLQKNFQVLDSFSSLLKEHYSSEARSVDFGDAAGTSKLINDEVAKLTQGLIKDLVPANAISAALRLILVNAVHFKGGWQHKFEAGYTEEGDFFAAPGETLRAQLMTLDGKFLQASNSVPGLDCQAVELPFVGHRFSMLFLLPRERDGLSALETKLAKVPLSEVRSALHGIRSRVVLPRFKLEASLELRAPLERLGMRDAFDATRADLSAVAGARDLVVDSVLHRACVAVDEEGCEAAAATAVMVGLMAMRAPELLDFRADHPFLVCVHDRETEVPLFVGRVARP